MNIFEILILGAILATCLIYIVRHIRHPFKKESNPCENCPYASGCDKKN